MTELSDLNEADLRCLFRILERDHPDALASSLATFEQECEDDDTDEDETNSNEMMMTSPQSMDSTKEDALVDVVETAVVSADIDNHEEANERMSPQSNDITEEDASVEKVDDQDSITSATDPPSPTLTPITTLPSSSSSSSPVPTPVHSPSSESSIESSTTPTPPIATPKPIKTAPTIPTGEGCYLHYEPSSAKLKLQYSKSNTTPHAIAFYSACTIPAFNYKKNFGRAELIGNCASGVQGRKNYYSGWCQFVRAARSALRAEVELYGESKGTLVLYPRDEGSQGLDVDVYVYDQMAHVQTMILPLNTPVQDIVCAADAVACLPKHSDIYQDVKQMDFNRWLTEANTVGATSRMTDESSKPKIAMNNRGSHREAASLYSTKKFVTPVYTKPVVLVSNGSSDDAGSTTTTTTEQDVHTYTHTPTTSMDDDDDEEEVALPLDQSEVEGCYLLYDPDSCKLMLNFSKTRVKNAIGFYCAGAGHAIQGFKFKRNFGRAELIGNCASGVTGRKNFYSGWCQFIKAARSVNGHLWIYPRNKKKQGLDVDIYVYYQCPQDMDMGEYQTVKLMESEKLTITEIDAVACLPKFTDFFEELKLVEINRWLTEGNTIGATSRFTS